MYVPATDQSLLTAPESLPRPEGLELFQSFNNCTNMTPLSFVAYGSHIDMICSIQA